MNAAHPPPCRHESPAPGACRWCAMACATDTRYHALWWPDLPVPAPSLRSPRALQCRHLGGPTGGLVDCPTCGGNVRLKLFGCGVYGQCTLQTRAPGAGCCTGCPFRELPRTPAPLKVTRLDLPGKGFNASLIRWKGSLLLAYRTGWAGAQIHVAHLTEDYRPLEIVTLPLTHARAGFGREDPRAMTHDGRLIITFIGVQGRHWGRDIVTNQMYARLRDDLTVESVHYPHYHGRQAWEKNWSMFSHDGTLYAVYSVVPHRVLRIEGDHATLAHETPWSPSWPCGHLRGGAPPVLVGDEWWHWFHGARGVHTGRTYATGVVTFGRDPPFRPLRYTAEPLIWADRASKPPDQYCGVEFPGGGVLENGIWKIASGVHDRWVEIREWDHAAVERALVRV